MSFAGDSQPSPLLSRAPQLASAHPQPGTHRRLTITKATGDTDSDGTLDELHAFGARSFSLWDVTGGGAALAYDSANQLEVRTFTPEVGAWAQWKPWPSFS